MKITFLSEYNPFDPDIWSGTPYNIAKSLARADIEMHYLQATPSQMLLPPFEELAFRCRSLWLKYMSKLHLDSVMRIRYAAHLAKVINKPLTNLKTDAILTCATPIASAYIESPIPIIYWTDYIYSAIANFYPHFRFHHPETRWDGHLITEASLLNAKLLIFSSEWAARSAMELHGISKNKIKVVPYGANLEITHTLSDVKNMIHARSKKCIKFLFVGKQWYRKGGDIVLKVLKALDAAGHPVELTIVGETPDTENLPSYVKCEGMLYKKSPEDLHKLKKLYQETHFLFVPSRAETYGIVFCEANAFGVPCLTTSVGGIPDVVKDGINGMKFSMDSTVDDFCNYITHIMENDKNYEALALSSFNEYQTRLNWQASSEIVKKLISELI